MENMKALYITVNAGFSEEIVDIARAAGAGGATIMNARGEGFKQQTIMGITVDSEKEIVLCVVEKNVAIKIMDAVKEKAGIGTPAHGVCYFTPVERATKTVANSNKIDDTLL